MTPPARRFGSLLLAVALGACAPRADLGVAHEELRVCADGETLDGIDVSHWQGTIDWDAVAGAGIRYAFIRVSDGLGTRDREFDRNWPEARRVGILRGAYQFFRPGSDPIAQADLLIERMGELEPGDLPPVIDVEATDGQTPAVVASRIRQWIDRVEAATGRRPIIYTGLYFWRDNVRSLDFADYPLWIAQYGPTCPDIPDPWTRWAFFQTGSTGRVSGISGNVDTDLFNGTEADLLAMFGGVATCGDGRCSGDETHDGCAIDCPICEPIPPAGRVLEEDELCFERAGGASGWRTVTGEGSAGALIWTYCIDGARDNHAWWHLDFTEAGRYRVEVHTPAPYAASRMAPYTIRHAGTEDGVVLDQSALDGWQVLAGEVDFAAGGDQWVHLEDATGEPYADRVQIAFDAVRLTRLDLPVDPDAGIGPDAGVGTDAGAPSGDAELPPPDAGAGGTTMRGTASGCGVASGRARGDALALALLGGLALAAARRRAPHTVGR